MNWSLHLRSVDRVLTLLAIFGFIAGGAVLFDSVLGGSNLEHGFLMVRHRPNNLGVVKPPREFPKVRSRTGINPGSQSPAVSGEPNDRPSSDPANFPSEAARRRSSQHVFRDVPTRVPPNEPEAWP